MATKNTTYKNWLTVGLVAGALALGACSKKKTTHRWKLKLILL
ncbi:hypothetical protein [Psychrobacter sp. JCM 18901]|nr:hypothetical protein [Psychrobacter sp. JCM 18901]